MQASYYCIENPILNIAISIEFNLKKHMHMQATVTGENNTITSLAECLGQGHPKQDILS